MIPTETYRAVMRNLAAGVTIVTTKYEDEYYGLTATSFTSVSLDPPLIQVSLDQSSRTHDAVSGAGFFAVNLLAEDQEQIARDFSSQVVDRFSRCEVVEGETGVPLLAGAIGHLECKVKDEVQGGDHTIFVGEVLSGRTQDRLPLLYFQGDYHRLKERKDQS